MPALWLAREGQSGGCKEGGRGTARGEGCEDKEGPEEGRVMKTGRGKGKEQNEKGETGGGRGN